MPTLTSKPSNTILLSGANGFIGTWIVDTLLKRGYSVRAAVRTEARGAHLLETFKAYGEKLQLCVIGDIAEEGAFDDAVKDVDGIIHTASLVLLPTGELKEIVEPAVNGVLGILASALKYGSSVRRIVVTSSCVAILAASEVPVTVSEATWNDGCLAECEEKGNDASPLAKYSASKTWAEKAAWDFYEKHKSEITWDMTMLHPPWVFGPVLHAVTTVDTLNSSCKFWYNALVNGDFMGGSPLTSPGHAWVDARDVAEAHVRSLEVEAAGGERIMICAGQMVWQDWIDTVKSLSPPPYVSHELAKGATGTVQRAITFDLSKQQRILGIKYRTMEDSARDILTDYTRRGW